MKITIIEKNFNLQGVNLVNEFDSYYEMETSEFSHKNSYEAAETLVKRFRKNDVSYSPYGFNCFEMYLNEVLIAAIDPCFTVKGETFLNWNDCFEKCNFDNDSTLFNVDTITKRFTMINYSKMIDILESEYEETFSE